MKTAIRTANEIRKEFLDFFEKECNHTVVPSSPVVPHDDPTLLFTNAGMNQFKDVFLGQGSRPYNRAVDTQKCIRAGGKHNDLEDVGRDSYHHTFFEMLGNWSFGDYFKEDAIAWAWKLLTDIWGLDPERLHVTVFEGDADDGTEPDTEAEAIWARYVPKQRIQRFGKKDNFWEMGDTGPCGPCSEIHYDATPDKTGANLVNADDPQVIEIWNLVFIQFNRGTDGKLTPLPEKHVDTGMGFERIVRVLQDKDSNYDTDVFTPIFDVIQTETGAESYGGSLDDPTDVAYRIIADHIRCLSVAIADGAQPSNEGRGYVLRRILRRAVRHAHQTLGVDRPVLHRLVDAVANSLAGAFPEIRAQSETIESIIQREEEMFLQTLDRGIELFEEAAKRAQDSEISADDAFKLHDTYGFPIDLTRVMAEERGMTVDEDGFESRMEQARERSKQKDAAETPLALTPDAIAQLRHKGVEPTRDREKYHGRPIVSEVRAIWNGRNFDEHTGFGARVAIITSTTCFYPEAGGQIGDIGTIHVESHAGAGLRGNESESHDGVFEVHDTQRNGDYVLHIGRVRQGALRVADRATLDIANGRRNRIRAHHTATHLLNHALRQVLGDKVEQKGSLVADDRLRFDYAALRAPTTHELNAIERLVNAGIHQALPVHADDVPLQIARKINGVRAVFGEKYPDPVRVVSIGPSIDRLVQNPDLDRWRECSIEFCGGTHLENTRIAKRCVIVSESSLAAGVRRIIAVTGAQALAADGAGKELESRAFRAKSLTGEELVEEAQDIQRQLEALTVGAVMRERVQAALDALRDKVKQVQKEQQSSRREEVVDQARNIAETVQGRIIVNEIKGADNDALRAAGDVLKSRRPEAACMLFSADVDAGKVSMLALVPKELIGAGLRAGDWIREAAQVVDGSGGGRPDMAQAGGKDPSNLQNAIRKAKDYAEERLQ